MSARIRFLHIIIIIIIINEYYYGGAVTLLLQDHLTMSLKNKKCSQDHEQYIEREQKIFGALVAGSFDHFVDFVYKANKTLGLQCSYTLVTTVISKSTDNNRTI